MSGSEKIAEPQERLLEAFLADLLGEDDDGEIELRLIPKEGGGARSAWYRTARELADLVSRAEEQGADNVYFGVGRRLDRGRGDAAVPGLRAAWADLDEKRAGGKTTGEVRRALLELEAPPTWIVSTGGGLHAYWALESLRPSGRVRRINAAIARRLQGLGADPAVVNPSRIMRLPGTLNVKYDPPRPCKIVEHLDRRYAPEDLERAFGVQDVPDAERPATTPTARSLLPCAQAMLRTWPREEGLRHRVALVVAGACRRAGWPEEAARVTVEQAAKAAGDEELEDRLRAVEDVYARQYAVAMGCEDEGLRRLYPCDPECPLKGNPTVLRGGGRECAIGPGGEVLWGRPAQDADSEEGQAVSLADQLDDAIREILEAGKRRARGGTLGVPTPFAALNEAEGLVGLTFLLGAPGAGKTSLAVQVAAHAARKGVPTLYVSLEMRRRELVVRLLASELRLEAARIRALDDLEKAPPELKGLLERWKTELRPLGLLDGCGGGLDTGAIRRAALDFHREHGRDEPRLLVVIDYLQLLRPTGGAARDPMGRFMQLADDLQALRNALRRKGLEPTILAVSAARKEDLESRRATPFGSVFALYHADLVLNLRAPKDADVGPGAEPRELVTEKSRYSGPVALPLLFHGAQYRFEEDGGLGA